MPDLGDILRKLNLTTVHPSVLPHKLPFVPSLPPHTLPYKQPKLPPHFPPSPSAAVEEKVRCAYLPECMQPWDEPLLQSLITHAVLHLRKVGGGYTAQRS